MKLKPLILSLLALLVVRIVLCAVTPIFDTSEARYAAISANMARSDDFLVPRFTYKGVYQSFDGKPPLLFQSAGMCCKALGVSPFAVRLPVLLAALGLLTLLYKVILLLSDGNRATALLAATMTAISTAFLALAGFCMTDGLLVAAVAGAILCHTALVKTGQRNWSLGVFALLACGMLIKGPVALIEFGLPVLLDMLVNRRFAVLKSYRWLVGIPIFLIIAAPWFVLMTRENPNFLRYFFINENLLRFLVHDYGDKYGAGRETFRGMAIIWLIVVTLPWSPFAIYRLWTKKRTAKFLSLFKSNRPESILAFGFTAITLFWTLTSRVPLAYLIPTVPLFTGWLAIISSTAERERFTRLTPLLSIISSLVLTVTLLSMMFTSDKMQGARAPYKPKRYSYEFYHGIHGIPEEVK